MAVPLILKRVATGIGIRKAISKDVKKAEIPQNEVNRIKRGLNQFAKGIVVKTDSNSKQVIKKLNKFEDRLSRIIDKGVKQAGFQLLNIIRTKTKKGIDFRDRPFAPYSEGYLKTLEREGKPTNVDLFYSGRMLGALTPSRSVKKTGNNKVSVAFTNSQMMQRALFNQVLNSPERKFFGFNDRTEKIISKQFNRFVEKEFSRVKL